MEPDKIVPPKTDITTSTVDDLHAEGVDVVADSGKSLDNEFSDDYKSEESSPSLEPEEVTEPQNSVPVTQVPVSTPAPIAPVSQETKTTPVTPVTPKPTEATPEQPKAPLPHNDPSIKQIRTFKSDAEEAIKYKGVSAIDIALAEQKKREGSTPIEYEKEKSSSGTFIIVAFVFVLLLGGGWYIWFSVSTKTTEVTVRPNLIKTLISYNRGSTFTLNTETDPLLFIASKLSASNAGLGNVYAALPVLFATSTEFVSPQKIFDDTRMPDRLKRSLSNTYMFGVYTAETNQPFIILKNTFFQNAFSGMLEWEKSMHDDLISFIQILYPHEMVTSQSSGTFEDIVVSNVDTRVLKNKTGEPLLLYAFPDKDTIVITVHATTLKYVLDKLLVVRTIQ